MYEQIDKINGALMLKVHLMRIYAMSAGNVLDP